MTSRSDAFVLVAFLFAFGNTAYAMGAKDYGAAAFSGVVAAICCAVGWYGSRA